MAWIKGNQDPRPNDDINEVLKKMDEHLDEKEAKVLLYRFLRENLTYSANVIMGINLFPFQHMAIKGMFKSDYFLGIWSRGLSKSWSTGIFAALYAIFNQGVNIGILSKTFRQCLIPDSLVFTKRGLIKAKDLKLGDVVFSEKGPNKILNKWENKSSEVMTLTTKRGYSITGKPEHQILCLDINSQTKIYKELQDITSDDIIAIQTGAKIGIERTEDIEDANDAYFYGLVIGDGCVSKKYGFADITTADKETVLFVENWAKRKNLKVNKRIKKGNTVSLRINNKDFINSFFYDYDDRKKAADKIIPKSVLRYPLGWCSHFLSGLFDADGSIQKDRIELATSSLDIAKKVQLMLLRFGIISKIQKENARGKIKICGVDTFGRESYKVRITGLKFIKLFKKSISFRLTRKRNYKVVETDKGNYDVVFGSGLFLSSRYSFPETLSKNLGKVRLEKILEKYSDRISSEDNEKLLELADLYWDKVENVENDGISETIDIEVENEHCYTANGLVNHNSKMIFRKIEDISKKPEAAFLQQCINHVSRSNDEWIMEIGESRILALPLGDGEKLRGFRFHVMIIDELLLMPEKILNEVIMPFLSTVEDPITRQRMHDAETQMIEAGLMKEEDRTKWDSNKLIGLSSASYKFEYLYKLYTDYEKLILETEEEKKKRQEREREEEEIQEDVHRVIMHFAYDIAPSKLYDKKLINQSKATMSQAQFEREFGSKFTDDSSGYFKISKMAACTFEDGQPPSVEIVGDKKEEYILAVDPSWSESESSDDFAMQVIKLDKANRKGILVHSYAMSGTNLKKHIAYFLYILDNFNIVSIVMDYNGGVQFLSAVNESALFKERKIKIGVIEDISFDDPIEYQKDLRDFKRQYNKSNHNICFLRKPSSSWIRMANESLQSAFDHKRMLFAGMAMDDEYYRQIKANPDISNLVFLKKTKDDEVDLSGLSIEKENNSRVVDFLEVQKDNVELTKTECALIEVSTSPQGNQTFDLPLSLKKLSGRNKARKDSYSALILGNWMMGIYFDMESYKDNIQVGFLPEIIK